MNDNPIQSPTPSSDAEKGRTMRTGLACFVAMITVCFSTIVLLMSPSWPAAMGITSLCVMSAAICFFALLQK